MHSFRSHRFAVAAALTWAVAAGAAPFVTPVKKAARVEDFAPATWTVEESVAGDLDGDGVDDAVVVLRRDEKTDPDGERALLVLLKRPDGFVIAATNSGLLECAQCGGVKGGGPPDIKIAKRVVAISQLSGSREYEGWTHRFRLDASGQRFELIGSDTGSGDSLTGEGSNSSTNFLTGAWTSSETKLVKPDCEPGDDCKTKTTKSSGKRPKKPLLRLEELPQKESK